MKLFGSVTSPFVRKIRVVLAEKTTAHDFVIEDVWSPQSQIAQRNPLSKVPTLELDDGTVLYDSKVLSDALDLLHPIPPLFPSVMAHRIAVKKLEALGDGIMEAAVAFFLEKRFHDDNKRSDPWLQRQLTKIDHACAAYDALLADSESGFLHKGFSVADICAGCALLYVELRIPEHNWRQSYPRVAAYVDQLAKRDSFYNTRPDA
jgi:glutathione S-transferase